MSNMAATTDRPVSSSRRTIASFSIILERSERGERREEGRGARARGNSAFLWFPSAAGLFEIALGLLDFPENSPITRDTA
jgi:hypothetical protein